MIELDSNGTWVDQPARPANWKADFSGYDTARVGLVIETDKPASFANGHEQRQWFDASDAKNGKTNVGHSNPAVFFTDKRTRRALTAPEKADVIEYLKTL